MASGDDASRRCRIVRANPTVPARLSLASASARLNSSRTSASLLVPGLESFHTLGGFGLILSHFENDPHHGHTIEAEISGLTGFNMNPLGITAQERCGRE